MTSGIKSITAASDGEDTAQRQATGREHGLAVLRGREAKALISLGMEALGEAHSVGHDLHTAIYDRNASAPGAELQDQLAEVLACLETAEHYLLSSAASSANSPEPAGRYRALTSDKPVPGLEGSHPPARPATEQPSRNPSRKR